MMLLAIPVLLLLLYVLGILLLLLQHLSLVHNLLLLHASRGHLYCHWMRRPSRHSRHHVPRRSGAHLPLVPLGSVPLWRLHDLLLLLGHHVNRRLLCLLLVLVVDIVGLVGVHAASTLELGGK